MKGDFDKTIIWHDLYILFFIIYVVVNFFILKDVFAYNNLDGGPF